MNTRSIRSIVFFFAVLALALVVPEARAASVQVRAGAGGLTGKNSQSGNFQREGVDVFIYEGRRVELFVGAELTSTKNASTGTDNNNGPSSTPINYSLDMTTATFGLRFKPAVSGRWRPYLALGVVAGKADYKADVSGQANILLLSTANGSTNFISPRVGLGMDVGLGEQWSIGIEATFTKSSPTFNVVVADFNTGQIEDRELNKSADMLGATLGLRYAF